jgi:ATP-dependent Clp protease ATP-binding subunit ClpC
MDWPILLLSFLVAAVIVGYQLRFQKGLFKKPAPPPAAAKISPADSKPAETPHEEIYRYAAAIEQFVEKSAHPRELLEQPDFLAAAAMLGGKHSSFDLACQYAVGGSWPLACAAMHLLATHPQRDSVCASILARIGSMRPWEVYFALRLLASLAKRPPVGAPLSQAQYWWRENIIIPGALREYLDERARLGDAAEFGDTLTGLDEGARETVRGLLQSIEHPSSSALLRDMTRWQEQHLDKTYLSSLGRFWGRAGEDDLLVVPEQWNDKLIAALAAVLKSEPRRSVLVSGDSRVGKTSFLRILGRFLADEGWSVFETSAAELMAGQTYFGQLEERIRKLAAELDVAKRVVLYVPDFLQLTRAGRHESQPASILDQLGRAMAGGKLVILSEATPAGMVRLFQSYPSLKGTMELVRFEAMNEAASAALVREVAAKISEVLSVDVTAEATDAVLHLSHQYLGPAHLPGTPLDLLKRSVHHAISSGAKTVAADDVMGTLSQMSGLPRSILDNDQRLELDSIRAQFTSRVIGQDEAVGAIVDRIAMLKAGLIDPKRPIGVFLFAGPTGTGKTELAKTLAAYLFGSPDRMARLDMSELQTAESTSKVLGTGAADSDSLADKVRKQPFSVVLLDEFEKAHPNVWDLFLQVFDDGRLTDAVGRTVDFRHTIIILTTNLGATAHVTGTIGFSRAQASYSESQVLQAIARTFRPEFVNRLDKVIVFRPLSRTDMRLILEKELSAVLERRGLRQRDWAVEYEDSAINFLLDKGFTIDMGARPLRRAIDQYLLAPLAATVVEHRYPDGDQFLFVRSDGRAIQVEFVDPDADSAPAMATSSDTADGSMLARAILGASGSSAELSALNDAASAIAARLSSAEWMALKDNLAARINDPGIWQREDRAAIFSQYEVMDRVAEAWRTAERLQARLDRPGKISRELAARLALQLLVVGQGIDDALSDAPVEVVLCIDAIGNHSPAWCADLLSMYRGWSRRRNMRLREFAVGTSTILQIAGFGAFRTLSEEAGLHVWEDRDGTRSTARLRVSAVPADLTITDDSGDAMARLLESTAETAAIVRRYRREPDALVRDARKGWRSGKLDAVLAGYFDLIASLSA